MLASFAESAPGIAGAVTVVVAAVDVVAADVVVGDVPADAADSSSYQTSWRGDYFPH